MGLFEKLTSSFGSGKLKKEQVERLREAIWNALADGRIDDQELSYIQGFYSDSELTKEDFKKLCSEIFQAVVEQAIADKRVSEWELASLNNILERFNIDPAMEAWAQEKIQYFREISRIESGAPLQTGNPTGLILQKSEVCYLSLPAQLYEERVVSRNYTGGSQGVSIRIVKGLTYRVGQQRGQMISQTGMTLISDGFLVVTNKRIVFSGSRKSVSTPLDKLLDLHVFADGINFSTTQRQKPVIVRLSKPEEADLVGVLLSRVLSEASS
jgi:hypothetical protein